LSEDGDELLSPVSELAFLCGPFEARDAELGINGDVTLPEICKIGVLVCGGRKEELERGNVRSNCENSESELFAWTFVTVLGRV
jgi:hypothetical protein